MLSLVLLPSWADWATLSRSTSIFRIWYLFLCIALLLCFESIASFIVWSFFTVITIRLMSCLSLQLSSITRWRCSIRDLISCSTFSWICIGILRPLESLRIYIFPGYSVGFLPWYSVHGASQVIQLGTLVIPLYLFLLITYVPVPSLWLSFPLHREFITRLLGFPYYGWIL